MDKPEAGYVESVLQIASKANRKLDTTPEQYDAYKQLIKKCKIRWMENINRYRNL